MKTINELQIYNQPYYEAILCHNIAYKNHMLSLLELAKKLDAAVNGLCNVSSVIKVEFSDKIALLYAAQIHAGRSSTEVDAVIKSLDILAWSEILVFRRQTCDLVAWYLAEYKYNRLRIRTLVDAIWYLLSLFRDVPPIFEVSLRQVWVVLDSLCGGGRDMHYNQLSEDEKRVFCQANDKILTLIRNLQMDRPITCDKICEVV